ncbi:MAG: amino acid permease [Nitrospirae bacterium CG_4_9_14_3_um_filter_53_35]|nr:MAG: amino acid permease [Nitrospirae bacterium CG2_30_53_67]PIS36300.1 MAG: amino acid permease [Nitrospirae bacterium CG08_land_8_20_14_0_20_52_24]PIV85426.1 MAG: amino acid permease [Nitrospirae bacterium CG17_big_fil_post_rev_8_21_14_2_50_50_9]PIW85062.1 MAG: amino acid permease [Nitrospirae bacterium CG_4_8_14_3_um_filter_50_41]PIX86004.1 MAG: amino acid permease [Nitrospirae bacterium CG_4_10_14_3_um_filter_53_41]PJA72766.1 MAG: amino acid permease [Nitrospirae bacterium CG_4_9_14_3_u
MNLRRQLFAVKTVKMIEEEMAGENRLRRVLGPVSLTALGVGAIIGAGIFVLTGLAAHDYAGPGLVLSFVIAGLGCAFAALSYAEFASMIPVAGSAYTYAYATLGELMAWIIGWDLILEYGMASSTVAYGWSKYFLHFLDLFGLHIPPFLASDPFSTPGAWFNLPAAAVVLLVTVVLVIGIRESARFNAAIVVLKLAVVLFVIVAGIPHVNTANWRPFMPFGLTGVASGAAYVFFAYIGFDSVSTHAEEARNPQRDVPIAIIASLSICTLLYIAVSAVLTGMVPYTKINIDAPLAAAFVPYGLTAAVFIISLGAVAGITSVLLVLMLSQPRVFFAMARDGLLPYEFFGTVHPRFRTPYKATILTGSVVAVVAALFPIHALAEMVNIGTLFAFVVVCAAVWIMRYTNPNQRRPFRCPMIPLVPALGVLFNIGLMFSLGWHNWARLTIWLGVGLIIYFSYGRYHSKLNQAEERTERGGHR